MKRWTTGLLAGVVAMLPASAGAQSAYPRKSIRLIVPTVAGGPSDSAARALAKAMSARQNLSGATHADRHPRPKDRT